MQLIIRAFSHEEVVALTTKHTQFDMPNDLVDHIEQTTLSAWRNPQIALEIGNLKGLYLHYAPVSGWRLVAWS